MPNLYDTAPAFDEPIAVIRHCHERIRKQLTTLDKLVNYLPDRGVDESVQSAPKPYSSISTKQRRCIIRMKKSIYCRHCAPPGAMMRASWNKPPPPFCGTTKKWNACGKPCAPS
jgi:hypothetical protein